MGFWIRIPVSSGSCSKVEMILQVARDCGDDLCIDNRSQTPVEVIQECTGGEGVERTLKKSATGSWGYEEGL